MWQIKVPPVALALLSLCWVAQARCQSSPAAEIGIIQSYTPPKQQYILRRGVGHLQIPIGLSAPVMNGDEFEVRGAAGRIVVKLAGDSQPVIISRNNSPYKIAVDTTTRPFWTGLLSWFATVIDAEFQTQIKADLYTTSSRGLHKLTAPILLTPQKLAAGRRSLTVGWLSDGSTVRVRLLRKPANDPLLEGASTTRQWTSPLFDFAPGLYRLELASAEGERVTGTLEFLDPHSLPALANNDLPAAAPNELRATAAAAWLASRDDGEYVLESLQAVLPLANRFEPAKVLARGLIEGSTITNGRL